MPSGDWFADAAPPACKPEGAVGFHVVCSGRLWLELDGARTDLEQGDIAAFPFGTPHWIGAGEGGRQIVPGAHPPPAPWVETPVLDFGGEDRPVSVLCGDFLCEALDFGPFRQMLPRFIYLPAARLDRADCLAATIDQIVAELDKPSQGGAPLTERLIETLFLEVLRRQFGALSASDRGWLAAIRDPVVGRCIEMLHAEPQRSWTLADLAKAAGLSRSALSARFTGLLGIAPMHYLRDWRLYLASVELDASAKKIAEIAYEAGYSTEAAFNRAFARCYGRPPAQWRSSRRNAPRLMRGT